MKNGWAWTSRQADSEDTISVLAIVETVAASLAWFLVVNHFGFGYGLISICIAPFLLLRTEASTALGVRMADRLNRALLPPIYGFMEWTKQGPLTLFTFSPIVLVLIFATLSSVAILAKFAATMISLVFSLPQALLRIPRNWQRITATTDLFTELTLLPGTDSQGEYRLLTSSGLVAIVRQNANVLAKVIVLSFASLFFLLPAYTYRFSLKSTAAIYAPLVYVVNASLHSEPKKLLHSICDFAISKVQRWYASLVAVLFVAKLAIYNGRFEIAKTELGRRFANLVRVYLVPDSIPAWQWASVFNAVLTFTIYFHADSLLRLNSEKVAGVRALKFVSGCLSLYTIAILIRVTWLEADIQIPPLGEWWPG